MNLRNIQRNVKFSWKMCVWLHKESPHLTSRFNSGFFLRLQFCLPFSQCVFLFLNILRGSFLLEITQCCELRAFLRPSACLRSQAVSLTRHLERIQHQNSKWRSVTNEILSHKYVQKYRKVYNEMLFLCRTAIIEHQCKHEHTQTSRNHSTYKSKKYINNGYGVRLVVWLLLIKLLIYHPLTFFNVHNLQYASAKQMIKWN